MVICVILYLIYSEVLIPFWIELKEDFIIHWWIYLITFLIIILVPIFIYFKFIKETPEVSSGVFESVYWGEYRSPVEIMAEKMRREESEDLKDVVETIETEESKEELNEDYVKTKEEKQDINVDFDKHLYKYYSINKKERVYLMKEGYKFVKYQSMLSKKKEKYLIKPRFNESVIHFLVIWDIQKFLESQEVEVKLFTTKKPDIIFEIDDKTYAIEVETGSVLKRSKKQVLEKMKVLKKEYDYGFIVVPTRRMVREYRKIVPVVDYRYLKSKLQRILKNRQD